MKEQSPDIDLATVESAAAAIKRYLDEHPGSADTVEGVAEWWLARQRVRETLAVVSQALNLLTDSGAVRKLRSVDGREIYAAVPETAKRADAIYAEPGPR